MSQFDWGVIDPNSKTGAQLALDLNNFRDAVNSLHKGGDRPPYAVAGMLWVRETSTDQWDLMLFDGDTDFVLRSINPTTNTLIPITSSEIQGLGTAATANVTTTSTDTTAGRLLKVSDFGVGAQLIAEATSLDADASTRFRAYGTSTVGAPTTNGGAAIVLSRGTSITTIAIDYVTGEMYFRPINSTYNWRKVFNSSNVTPFIQGLFTATDAAAAKAALEIPDSLGVGQTWSVQSRAAASTYMNNTGRTIAVSIRSQTSSASNNSQLLVSGVTVSSTGVPAAGTTVVLQAIIPPGATYRLEGSNTPITQWLELR